MAFLTSLESILSIILIILLGYILKEKKWFDDGFSSNVSRLIMNVALPASIFVSVLKYLTIEKLISLSGGLIYTFLSVIMGYIIAWIMIKILKVKSGRRGTFINTVVNANTIFIGLPLNIALFGNESLPYFLVYYITNTVSTWAFGVILIENDNPEKTKTKKGFNWKKLLPPPLLGFLVALIFLVFKIPVPDFIHSALTYTGNIVTPLSLIYIGIVLSDAGLKSIHFDKDTIFALLGRFIMSPCIMVILIILGTKISGTMPALESKTYIIQASAPALAVLPILANESNGDVKYAIVVAVITNLFK